jgi:hypothetical protein
MLQTCMSRTVTTEKSQSDKEYSYCVQTRERETFKQRFCFLGANFHQLANLLFSKDPKNY